MHKKSRMSNVGNNDSFMYSFFWSCRGYCSFSPFRLFTVEHPIDKSTFFIIASFYAKRFSRRPADIIESFSIKMIIFFSLISLTCIKNIYAKKNDSSDSKGYKKREYEDNNYMHVYLRRFAFVKCL